MPTMPPQAIRKTKKPLPQPLTESPTHTLKTEVHASSGPSQTSSTSHSQLLETRQNHSHPEAQQIPLRTSHLETHISPLQPSKILERLVLNNITPHINLSPSQHGFRSQRSTFTLLTKITQTILECLNSQKPALLAVIDLSKGFDTVPRHLLFNKILNTHVRPNFKKWFSNFLLGRHRLTVKNGKSSGTLHNCWPFFRFGIYKLFNHVFF